MKKRIAIINSHPIQYFAPLYAHLNAQPDLDVTVYYLSDISIRGEMDKGFGQEIQWDVDLLSGYRSVFMNGYKTSKPSGFLSLLGLDLWRAIRRERFDAVLVHGHQYAANIVALAAAKSVGTATFMRNETTLLLKRDTRKERIRRKVLPLLYRTLDGVLAIGTLNAEYYQAMGVPADKISIVPYSVDNDRFTASSAMTKLERTTLRESLGVSDGKSAIVYASKFQRRKHPDSVIRAAHAMVAGGANVELVMIGSGEMDVELRALAADGPAKVHFTGFVNQSMLPRYLASCDVFVLPSEEEPWGLIVNEAMNAGLPVIVGKDAGCVRDLVRNGDNGFAVEPGNVRELQDRLTEVVDEPTQRHMAERSRAIVHEWGYAQCAQGWRQALSRI